MSIRKKIHQIFLIFIISGFTLPVASVACTGGIALGFTSAEGNILFSTFDWSVPVNLDYMRVRLVIPEDKNKFRFLKAQGFKDSQMMGEVYLNEKGVATKPFFRVSQSLKLPDKGQIPNSSDIIASSSSARNLVDKLSKIFTKIGTANRAGGMALLVVDTKEGYLIEGSNFIYNSKLNNATIGPMTNMVFANANFYLNKTLREHQIGSGVGYSRAKAMWKMMIENQYNDYNLNPTQGSGLVLPYLMDMLKYHDNRVSMLENERISSYTVNDNQSINVQGSIEETYSAMIINPSSEYTKYLSTMWLTFGEPDISPFLPFFIGVNEIPQEYSTTVAAKKFFKLRTLLLYNPEYRSRVIEYWKAFEVETIEKYRGINSEVSEMLNNKNTEMDVRLKLTNFVKERCGLALKKADKIISELEKQPILKKIKH